MKSFPILFREESRLPRLLTWPLVFLGAGAVASAVAEPHETQPSWFTFFVIAGALCTVLLLEFVAVAIEVTETEVRFCISPFYQRRIVIAKIGHWEVRTYLSPARVSFRQLWRPPSHCVEMTMKDGALFTITSAHAEQLSNAIAKAKEMSAGHEVHSAIRN